MALIAFAQIELAATPARSDDHGRPSRVPESGAGRCVSFTSSDRAFGETIALVPAPGTSPAIVHRAVESWQACPSYGTEFPRFVVDAPGTRTVQVRRVAGSSGSRRCGSFVESTITLYGKALDPDGRPRLCADAAVTLAHELGHALGLADQHDQRSCGRAIMAQTPERARDARRVTAEECRALSLRWTVDTQGIVEIGG